MSPAACLVFFPVKDIEVVLVDGDAVYAGGMPIGIYVKTSGVLVIGTSEVERPDGSEAAPAENILKAGDYILSVNGGEGCREGGSARTGTAERCRKKKFLKLTAREKRLRLV